MNVDSVSELRRLAEEYVDAIIAVSADTHPLSATSSSIRRQSEQREQAAHDSLYDALTPARVIALCALPDIVRESAPMSWAAGGWHNGAVDHAVEWEKKASAALADIEAAFTETSNGE